MFYQCDGIHNPFNGSIEDIKFQISELKNAAQVAKSILELSEEEKIMLTLIIHTLK